MGKRGSHGSWSEVCRTALPGKLLEMQILRPHTRAAEWESGGGGGQHSVLTSPPWESDGHPNWRTKKREAFRGELSVLDRAPQPAFYACPSAFPNPGPTLCSCHLWGPFSCSLTHTLPSVHSHTQGQGHTHLSAFVLHFSGCPSVVFSYFVFTIHFINNYCWSIFCVSGTVLSWGFRDAQNSLCPHGPYLQDWGWWGADITYKSHTPSPEAFLITPVHNNLQIRTGSRSESGIAAP